MLDARVLRPACKSFFEARSWSPWEHEYWFQCLHSKMFTSHFLFFHSSVMYVRRQKSSVGFTQSFLGFLSHQVKLSWAMPPVNDYFQPILPFRKLFSWYTSQNLHFLTPSHYVFLSPYISNFLFPNWIWNPCAQLLVSCRIVHIQLTSYFLLEKPF